MCIASSVLLVKRSVFVVRIARDKSTVVQNQVFLALSSKSKNSCKVKIAVEHAMKAQRGSRGIALLFL